MLKKLAAFSKEFFFLNQEENIPRWNLKRLKTCD